MKKIIIVHSNLEIGGAESSLIGLLQSIDYSRYEVDLLLLEKKGELLKFVPSQVNIIENKQYSQLVLPIKKLIKSNNFTIAFARLKGKFKATYEHKIKKYNDLCYITKQYSYKNSMKFFGKLDKKYDLGISFIDPHYILTEKINCNIKLGWIHTDFSRIDVNKKIDFEMWDKCDYIVSVSEACKNGFDKKYPNLKEKSIVIENLLSKDFILEQSKVIDVSNEIEKSQKDSVNLLSIGRFSYAKNFDNIPQICRNILEKGLDVKWYIIGYGGDEELIKSKIEEFGMQKNVIIIGKKENPYPYIKACDIYVQPSRYEGKAVAVREAQILNKPVVITNFETSKSQLTDGFDGVIVPMDNEGCAEGICNLIKDKKLQQKLIENTKITDYTNKQELEKIYALLEG